MQIMLFKTVKNTNSIQTWYQLLRTDNTYKTFTCDIMKFILDIPRL